MLTDALSYVTLTSDQADPELFGAVISRVHVHNSSQVVEEGRLGVHFLSDTQVRLFGSGAALQHFGNHPHMRRMLNRLQVSAPAQVPAGAPRVRVSKFNPSDRDKPTYRARYRGHGRRDDALRSRIQAQAADGFRVYLHSGSTGKDFSMVVLATPVSTEAAGTVRFNNYGMCLEGGVPVF